MATLQFIVFLFRVFWQCVSKCTCYFLCVSGVVEVNEVIQLFTQRVGGHRRRIISVRHGFTRNTTLQVILCTAHNVKKVIYIETCHFKGIVHPKIKIVSSFTHPQVVPNLYECLFCWTQRWYSEEWGKQSSSGTPLTSIVFFFLLWKSMVPKTTWLQTFFRISSFVFIFGWTIYLSILHCWECPCCSVVEHCVSSAKGCGFDSQGTHILTKIV